MLLESNFRRISDVNFPDDANTKIDVKVGSHNKDKTIIVEEVVNLTNTFKDLEQISITVKMVGVFERIGKSPITDEEFGNINGAAIIFPYIREHISNLSVKAGLGMILIPPINFKKRTNELEDKNTLLEGVMYTCAGTYFIVKSESSGMGIFFTHDHFLLKNQDKNIKHLIFNKKQYKIFNSVSTALFFAFLQ